MKAKFTHSILLSAALLCASVGTAWSQNEARERENPTLSVNGQSEVMVRPDRARVDLGAQAQAPTAQQAQNQVNSTVQSALQQIRGVGIAERAIQTSGLQLFPVYEENNENRRSNAAPRILAYRASNTVCVEIDDLSLVGKVIDAGVKAGANSIDGIRFELRDDTAARSEALQKAVNEARTKAQVLAAAAGVDLGELAEIQEDGVNVVSPRAYGGESFALRAATSTPIQPGELRVQANVSLRYRIKAR